MARSNAGSVLVTPTFKCCRHSAMDQLSLAGRQLNRSSLSPEAIASPSRLIASIWSSMTWSSAVMPLIWHFRRLYDCVSRPADLAVVPRPNARPCPARPRRARTRGDGRRDRSAWVAWFGGRVLPGDVRVGAGRDAGLTAASQLDDRPAGDGLRGQPRPDHDRG